MNVTEICKALNFSYPDIALSEMQVEVREISGSEKQYGQELSLLFSRKPSAGKLLISIFDIHRKLNPVKPKARVFISAAHIETLLIDQYFPTTIFAVNKICMTVEQLPQYLKQLANVLFILDRPDIFEVGMISLLFEANKTDPEQILDGFNPAQFFGVRVKNEICGTIAAYVNDNFYYKRRLIK